jgi:hypothetical protein
MKHDPFEDELDAIRIAIYEKTKDMTTEERVNYFNRRARESMKANNIRLKIIEAPGQAPIMPQL